jgi:BMFP domain-containing protein YqiC
MLAPKAFLDALSDQASRLFTGDGARPRADLEGQFKALMQSAFSKLELVSREEFDSQMVVLSRTRARLEALEQQVAALEARLQPAAEAPAHSLTPSALYPELLFSYGTLQDKAVQLAKFGRELTGQEDRMLGYRQDWVEITDPAVVATSGKSRHPIVFPSDTADDSVSGKVFQISAAELAAADDYEVSDYTRVAVTLASGLTAWAYVRA